MTYECLPSIKFYVILYYIILYYILLLFYFIFCCHTLSIQQSSTDSFSWIFYLNPVHMGNTLIPPPTAVGLGGKHYVFGLAVRPSVRLSVRPSSRQHLFLATRYLCT